MQRGFEKANVTASEIASELSEQRLSILQTRLDMLNWKRDY